MPTNGNGWPAQTGSCFSVYAKDKTVYDPAKSTSQKSCADPSMANNFYSCSACPIWQQNSWVDYLQFGGGYIQVGVAVRPDACVDRTASYSVSCPSNIDGTLVIFGNSLGDIEGALASQLNSEFGSAFPFDSINMVGNGDSVSVYYGTDAGTSGSDLLFKSSSGGVARISFPDYPGLDGHAVITFQIIDGILWPDTWGRVSGTIKFTLTADVSHTFTIDASDITGYTTNGEVISIHQYPDLPSLVLGLPFLRRYGGRLYNDGAAGMYSQILVHSAATPSFGSVKDVDHVASDSAPPEYRLSRSIIIGTSVAGAAAVVIAAVAIVAVVRRRHRRDFKLATIELTTIARPVLEPTVPAPLQECVSE